MNKRRRNRAKSKDIAPPQQAGWRIGPWCDAIPCSRAMFYKLEKQDPELLRTCKIGAMTVVLIAPGDYLAAKAARAAEQAEATARATAKAARLVNDRAHGRPRRVARTEPASPPARVAAAPPDRE
jgi:hypothetical protein